MAKYKSLIPKGLKSLTTIPPQLTPKRVLTAEDIEAALVAARPEFADSKGVDSLFGIKRSLAYLLANEGKIRSVCIRRPGAVRGKRLWDCESIRAYLRANMEGKAEKGCCMEDPRR